jgi:SAM-dependent methyltransferase
VSGHKWLSLDPLGLCDLRPITQGIFVTETRNLDHKTVDSFGEEWSRFSQDAVDQKELQSLFDSYFAVFPWSTLPSDAEGFDMGCGSGRWAKIAAAHVGKLNCIDASAKALDVARKNLSGIKNVHFIGAGVSDRPLPDNSQDFGYSLGVLHHIPDTKAAMKDCTRMLKPGAPFLVYLYYRFDNMPVWYKWVWRASNLLRVVISNMPGSLKDMTTDLIAFLVYLPLSRLAKLGERLGLNVDRWLLSNYRDRSVYTLRTDSRDRFGTPLEQRFTRAEITDMMHECGLEDIKFSDAMPFWCAVGTKTGAPKNT